MRSMAEWMERSSTESASLTKMNTMLTSGRLSGNERFRHLERRMTELLDLLVTPGMGLPPNSFKSADGLRSLSSPAGLISGMLKVGLA